MFLKAIELFLDARPGDVGAAVFDKDDALAVEFVTAASNLRALCYDIPIQSLFNAKVGCCHKAVKLQLHRDAHARVCHNSHQSDMSKTP